MDIRKFFTPVAGKAAPAQKSKVLKDEDEESPVPKKKHTKRAIITDSDDEDPIPKSKSKEKHTPPKPAEKLKPITICEDIFSTKKSDKFTGIRDKKELDKLPKLEEKSDSLSSKLSQKVKQEKESKHESRHKSKERSRSPEKSKKQQTEKKSKERSRSPEKPKKQQTEKRSKERSRSPEKSKEHQTEKKEKPKTEKSKDPPSEMAKPKKITPEKPKSKKVESDEEDIFDITAIKKQSKSSEKTPGKETSKPTGSSEKSTKNSAGHKSSKRKGDSYSLEVTHNEKKVKAEPKLELPEPQKEEEDESTEQKKRHSFNYQQYLHREGPKNPGSKEIPEGAEGCLTGLTFVVTGVLDSLDRVQAEELAKKYGAKVTHAVSGKTSYIVAGEGSGPAKLEKAKNLGVKVINEDDLLEMIRTRPSASGAPPPASKTPKRKKKEEIEEMESPVAKKAITPKRAESPPTKKQKISPKVEKQDDKKVERKTQVKETKKESSDVTASQPASPDAIAAQWVDKYRPTTLKQVVGQQGDKSCLNKLVKWLQNWHKYHTGEKKPPKPSPWAKDDDGGFYNAVLISGPPGIGKTTTAHVVAKELGFDVVEMNASDTRSKRLLKEEVSELISNRSLAGFVHGDTSKKASTNHLLIMDEVDGMAGNEDRGGIQELILLIKSSRIPLICICNDRAHPKIRSLVNHCFDLRMPRPRIEQIRALILSICFKEHIKIKPEAIDDMIRGTNFDIRQIINNLSMVVAAEKIITSEGAKKDSNASKKDLRLGPWDVIQKVFSAEQHKGMTIHDKSDLFFQDYSLGPLFVQDSYLQVVPHAAKNDQKKTLDLMSRAADSLCDGDLVEKIIRSNNAWSLLPVQAMYSSVIPGEIMEGHFTGQIGFPQWLGKNSTTGKNDRLLQHLQMHMRLRITGGKGAVNMDYVQYIRDAILHPLVNEGADGVGKAVEAMTSYDLIREDLEDVISLATWPGRKDSMGGLDSKVKAAFTRALNKEGHLNPYADLKTTKVRGGGGGGAYDEEGLTAEDEEALLEEGDENEDDVAKDSMIKVKAKPRGKAGETSVGTGRGRGKSGASTSTRGQAKGSRGRGRGK